MKIERFIACSIEDNDFWFSQEKALKIFTEKYKIWEYEIESHTREELKKEFWKYLKTMMELLQNSTVYYIEDLKFYNTNKWLDSWKDCNSELIIYDTIEDKIYNV